MFHWSDYSSDSTNRDTPLLLSERSIQLALAAVASIQPFFRWNAADSDEWNDIDHAVAQLLFELMDATMPDFTPVGTVVWYLGVTASIPAKWLRCEGQTLNDADYPELADVLDTPFHAHPDIILPDLREKFLYGGSFNSDLGDTGGAATHALTTAELPAHHHITAAHSHTVGTRPAAGSNTGSVSLGSLAANGTIATSTQAATDTSDTGGAGSHNNMPPYMRGFWIMKVLP